MNEQFVKDQCLVLKKNPLKDDNEQIVFLGKELGKINVLARGVSKSTNKNSSLTSIGNCINVELLYSISGYILLSCSPINEFSYRFNSYESLLTSVYFCDLVEKTTVEGEVQEDIFLLLFFCLSLMDDSNFVELRLFFEWQLLNILGYSLCEKDRLDFLLNTLWHSFKFTLRQRSIADEIDSFLKASASLFKNKYLTKLSKEASKALVAILQIEYRESVHVHIESQGVLNEATRLFYS